MGLAQVAQRCAGAPFPGDLSVVLPPSPVPMAAQSGSVPVDFSKALTVFELPGGCREREFKERDYLLSVLTHPLSHICPTQNRCHGF